jgi:hypothetical protein
MNRTMLMAAVVTALATGSAHARGPGGEEASYTFSKPPVDSLGVQSLADLRGKPVLIDFWGTR